MRLFFHRKIQNSFKKKFIWYKQIFIWPKDILFDLNKCYLIQINLLFESKKAFQTNYFLLFNQIFFPMFVKLFEIKNVDALSLFRILCHLSIKHKIECEARRQIRTSQARLNMREIRIRRSFEARWSDYCLKI